MMLHASRLVVPRGAKPTIDVTAPLPPRFGGWSPFVGQPETPFVEKTRAETGDEA